RSSGKASFGDVIQSPSRHTPGRAGTYHLAATRRHRNIWGRSARSAGRYNRTTPTTGRSRTPCRGTAYPCRIPGWRGGHLRRVHMGRCLRRCRAGRSYRHPFDVVVLAGVPMLFQRGPCGEYGGFVVGTLDAYAQPGVVEFPAAGAEASTCAVVGGFADGGKDRDRVGHRRVVPTYRPHSTDPSPTTEARHS